MKTNLHHSIRARTSVRFTFFLWRRCGLKSALLSTALALVTQAAFAQTWSTVDDFQYSLGTNSYATGLAKDPTGTIIYSAGDGQDASGIYHALAFKSIDGGTTWPLLDDYVDPTSAPGGYGPGYDAGIAVDPFGNLYAAGFENFPNGAYTWFTRRSLDGGATWSTVDSLHSFSGETYSPYPTAIATDAGGNVYVVGTTNFTWWLVRKGTVDGSGGISWATVDLFSGTSSHAYPNGVFCHPSKGVFVVGKRIVGLTKTGGYIYAWTVRRSQDGGATWTVVDTFQLDSSQEADAQGVGGDSSGNIYVVGGARQTYHGASTFHWIVRKSSDGGQSWQTVDNFQPSQSVHSQASAFSSDAHGNLFVAGTSGSTLAGSTAFQWLVRKSLAGSGSWQTVDTFQLAPSQASVPRAVIGNSSGNVFVSGYGTDAARVQHWIVRKE